MILLRNKCEKNSACDAKNAQIWNLSVPEIVCGCRLSLPGHAGELTALPSLSSCITGGASRQGKIKGTREESGKKRWEGKEGRGKRRVGRSEGWEEGEGRLDLKN